MDSISGDKPHLLFANRQILISLLAGYAGGLSILYGSAALRSITIMIYIRSSIARLSMPAVTSVSQPLFLRWIA